MSRRISPGLAVFSQAGRQPQVEFTGGHAEASSLQPLYSRYASGSHGIAVVAAAELRQ